jgi:hypothetical protein
MANRQFAERTKGAIGAESGVMFGDGVWLFTNSTTPTDGASGTGAGWAGIGSICVAVDTGEIYTNTGTKAAPTWTNQT